MLNPMRDKNEAKHRGEGTTPVTTAFVQKIAEGKTSYDLSRNKKTNKNEIKRRCAVSYGICVVVL